jgi:hypothetical protein
MKFIPINIRIYAWDSGGMRHETKYSLIAVELGSLTFAGDPIAPGLMLSSRFTITKPVWLLKLLGRVAGVPLLGAMFREKRQ